MKTITRTWFETKVTYHKPAENGMQEKITEQNVVEATSFAEAENNIIKQFAFYNNDNFTVKEIKRATYQQVIVQQEDICDKWYKAKIIITTIDEKTEKEHKYNYHILVNAIDINDARKAIDQTINGTMQDANIHTIQETNIIDVFEQSSIQDT